MAEVTAIEKGKINKARYAEYVATLELMGQKFPVNNFGDVNLSLIASTCGFNRQVFATNKSMKEQLAKDVKKLGIDIKEQRSPAQSIYGDKDSAQLKQAVELKDLEILSLKKQIDELLKIVQSYEASQSEQKAIHEELLLSGRRFVL